MRPRISITGFVRRSVGRSVCPSVGPLVTLSWKAREIIIFEQIIVGRGILDEYHVITSLYKHFIIMRTHRWPYGPCSRDLVICCHSHYVKIKKNLQQKCCLSDIFVSFQNAPTTKNAYITRYHQKVVLENRISYVVASTRMSTEKIRKSKGFVF